MRAFAVFHGVGDVRLDSVKEPKLREPADALVRLTASAICGTDLHNVIEAYERFDQREEGWVKVMLQP